MPRPEDTATTSIERHEKGQWIVIEEFTGNFHETRERLSVLCERIPHGTKIRLVPTKDCVGSVFEFEISSSFPGLPIKDINFLSYDLLEEGKAIRCKRCLMLSYNPNDVQNRYCGKCKHFHHSNAPILRRSWVELGRFKSAGAFIACPNKDSEVIQFFNLEQAEPPENSIEATCECCKRGIWVGPKRREFKAKNPSAGLICFICTAVKHAEQGGSPDNIVSLGGKGGTYEFRK